MEGMFPVGLIECCLPPIRFCCLIFERLETIVCVSDIIFGEILNVSNSIFFYKYWNYKISVNID